jgi:hypothetical protein
VGGVPPAILMEWIHLGCIDTRQQKDVNNGLSLRLRMQNFADMCLQAAPRWELCSRTVGGHSWRRRTSTMWNQALDSRSLREFWTAARRARSAEASSAARAA